LTIDEQLERITATLRPLADTVIAHDRQIGLLIELADKHEKAITNLERQWQAYLNTLPRQ
jgi:hypothetical protein